MIVILSDHGHPLGDHGKFLKGADRMYSELLKVPFIVRLPGGQYGGRRTEALGRFPDLTPTLLDLAGVGGNNLAMAGRSLRPILEGSDESPYKAVVAGFHTREHRCIRNGQFSLFLNAESDTDELYDLKADPRERTNVIADHGEVVAELMSHIGSKYFMTPRPARGVQGDVEVAGTALE